MRAAHTITIELWTATAHPRRYIIGRRQAPAMPQPFWRELHDDPTTGPAISAEVERAALEDRIDPDDHKTIMAEIRAAFQDRVETRRRAAREAKSDRMSTLPREVRQVAAEIARRRPGARSGVCDELAAALQTDRRKPGQWLRRFVELHPLGGWECADGPQDATRDAWLWSELERRAVSAGLPFSGVRQTSLL